MDATGARRGIAAAPTSTEPAASPATRAATSALVEHASGHTQRGITAVTGGDLRRVRPGTSPVQVLPGDGTHEPPSSAVSGATAGVTALFAEVADIVAAVQSAAGEAASMKEAADRANKAAAAYLKEAQDWVNKAVAHAGRGRSAEAEEAMAKAREAFDKATAQEVFADRAAAEAQAASERAQSTLSNAQAALDELRGQGFSRTELLSPTTLVDQAGRLATAAGKAATAAATAANAVRTTLSTGADPSEVSNVLALIADAQAEFVNAQKAATASTGASSAANGAAKNANSRVAFVQNALDSGGTEAADPQMELLTGFRDTAVTGATEAREHASESQRLSASSAAKAETALAAARELADRLAAAGKNNALVTSLTKAAQQAKDNAVKAQRSAAIADKAAATALTSSRAAQASLDDAHGRVQRYLDALEAANNPIEYSGGGY